MGGIQAGPEDEEAGADDDGDLDEVCDAAADSPFFSPLPLD